MKTHHFTTALSNGKVRTAPVSAAYHQDNERLVIQRAEATHSDAIAKMARRLAWETERRKEDPATVRRGVALILQVSIYFAFVVLDKNGRCIGMLLAAGHEWSETKNKPWLLITSLYVQKKYRRRGVAHRLIEAALHAARENGFRGVRLYCHCKNRKARKRYRKSKFKKLPYLVYEKRC